MAKPASIGLEHLPVIEAVAKVLDDYDPLKQQQIIEMLFARHVMLTSRDLDQQKIIMDGMTKHVRQIVNQWMALDVG